MTSLGTGVGTGLGILVSRMDGTGDTGRQRDLAKSGLWLGLANALVFAAAGALLVEGYFALSSDQPEVRAAGIQYGRIIFLGSLGLFVESNCTKLLQAKGNMLLPMLAQVAGAVINLVLDPVLIFGLLGAPELGVAGAAVATVLGQWAAMGITLAAVWRTYGMCGRLRFADCRKIFRCGLPSIAMQSLYTLYIIGLNLILKQFTEDAVTVLGIYYKLQAFFFIPLMGLQQVIVPVISYNHGAGSAGRVRETLRCAVRISVAVMALATGGVLGRAGMAALDLFPRRGHPGHRRAGAAAYRPQLCAGRCHHDAHRLFPGRRPGQKQPVRHGAAAGRAAGAPCLGAAFLGPWLCVADLPFDRACSACLQPCPLPGQKASRRSAALNGRPALTRGPRHGPETPAFCSSI